MSHWYHIQFDNCNEDTLKTCELKIWKILTKKFNIGSGGQMKILKSEVTTHKTPMI